MATMHVARAGLTLKPCFQEDMDLLVRMKEGVPYALTYQRNVNLKHHRKFFVLVGFVADHHPVYDNKTKALDAIKIAAGHVDFLPNPITGELYPVPRSIRLDKMDQDAFETFYNEAVQGILDHLAMGVSRETIDTFVAEVSRY